MLRKIMKRVLFGKKRNYDRRKPRGYQKYVSWHAHNKLQAKVDNLMSRLDLKSIGNGSLVGDEKDEEKFRNQFDY
mgnify:CR=1 FL=1